MATIQGTVVIQNDNTVIASWSAITEADTGTAVDLSKYPWKSVQVTGDFTSSGAITLEGSNDGGVTYGTLTDNLGNTLVITSNVPRVVGQNTLLVRPRATAGSAVSMSVVIIGNR